MNLEKKNSERTNYHLNRFVIGFFVGGIGSLVFGKYVDITPFLDSLLTGCGYVP